MHEQPAIRARRRRGSSWAMDVHRAPCGKVHRVRWSGMCGASGTVVLVKHGSRTTRRNAGCRGRLWRLIPSCRTSAELPRRFWSSAARPRRGALSANSIRREQVAAHLGDSGRNEQRHLHHEQRIDRLGAAGRTLVPSLQTTHRSPRNSP